MRQLVTNRYDRKARLLPAVLVAAPTLLLAVAAAPAAVTTWGLVVPLAAFCLPFLVAQVTRNRGLRVQDELFRSWGGRPSENLLRWRSGAPKVLVARRHLLIRRNLHIELPDETEEAAEPVEADAAYAAATTALRERTRDPARFPLVFAENVTYGFWRNAYACRAPATVVIVLSATATVTLGRWSVVALGSVEQIALISVDLLAAVIWWMCINQAAVRRSAEQYAEQLFASLETLEPGHDEVRIAGDVVRFPGSTKLDFVRRMQTDWRDLAEVLGVPSYEQRRFRTGDEPRALWEWLEVRNRLGELPDALELIDRSDLARILRTPRS